MAFTRPIAKLRVKRLVEKARLPEQMTDGSAGFDLFACEECLVGASAKRATVVGTGIAVGIPTGYEGQIRPRSGMAAKKSITVLNSPGTIDSDYRGEVKVLLMNHGGGDVRIKAGDRIAQLVIVPVPFVEIEEVEELGKTVRGSGGFGSTGA